MAAIDGIQNKIDPGKPLEKTSLTKSDVDRRANVGGCPASLWDALEHLKNDGAFLLEGDVFSASMLEQWIGHKETAERTLVESHATPSEYLQYFDC